MSYLSEAHDRLIHKLSQNTPPNFALFNSADTFEFDAAKHIEDTCAAINDYLHSIAVELQSEGADVEPRDLIAPLADLKSDLVYACNARADDLRESMLEAAQ